MSEREALLSENHERSTKKRRAKKRRGERIRAQYLTTLKQQTIEEFVPAFLLVIEL